jgi:hypothetical protein
MFLDSSINDLISEHTYNLKKLKNSNLRILNDIIIIQPTKLIFDC